MVSAGALGVGIMLFSVWGRKAAWGYVGNAMETIGRVAVGVQSPGLYTEVMKEEHVLWQLLEQQVLRMCPLYHCVGRMEACPLYVESVVPQDMMLVVCEDTAPEKEQAPEEEVPDVEVPKEETPEEETPQTTVWAPDLVADEEKMYPLSSIRNYELALDTFYQVDSTTMLGEDLLKVEEFLQKDMTLKADAEGPQILIYHTHSQESYAGSDKTVVDVGDVLTQLLEDTYGIKVLHHKGEYDVESRDYAYSNALPDLIRILEEYPSIEVVIDLHRDGVNEDVHLVTTIDGKPTAKLMFFNGVSQTKKNGKIDYLENPYLEENLAFSFQMQLAARTYYPTLTRDNYIKGYRYNMHLMPKSLLVEVGAQTNTFEEAANAMEYLAKLLYAVLTIKR